MFACEDKEKDCAGVAGGTSYEDECGGCDANVNNDCVQDCADVWGGTAQIDSCNVCVGGNTGEVACTEDCAGVEGGTATIDSCGLCTGGTTGLLPNYLMDCAGECGGSIVLDECGECGGDNSTCTDDCGVPNGNNVGQYGYNCTDISVLQDIVDINLLLQGNSPLNPHSNISLEWNNDGRLKSFSASNLGFAALPETIEKWAGMEALTIYSTDIEFVPSTICNLPNDCEILISGGHCLTEEYHFDCILFDTTEPAGWCD